MFSLPYGNKWLATLAWVSVAIVYSIIHSFCLVLGYQNPKCGSRESFDVACLRYEGCMFLYSASNRIQEQTKLETLS